jgi:hypothetical protein
VPDFYVEGAKHEIGNIRKAYILEVCEVNKLGKSDASTDELYKLTVP